MNAQRRLLLIGLALSAKSGFAASDATFMLSASADDFDSYFPSYLSNGYFSTMTAPRGTEGNLAYMVAFMDYGMDDIARPAAIPGWSEIDYSTGNSAAGHFWMNQVPLSRALFADYGQTLDMHDAMLTTRYRYVDHTRSTQVQVTTFVSQASQHIGATRLSITPDFDGTVQLSFALNLWAPEQPRLPLAKLTGDEMQEAVAAQGRQLVAIAPATPDRQPVWYHGDTHVTADDGDPKDLSLWLDGRAEQGLAMAQAATVRLPKGVEVESAALYRSQYRLALNLTVKVQKSKTYTFDKFVAASREGWGGDAKADLALARAARNAGFDDMLGRHRAAWSDLWKSDIVIEGDDEAQRAVHSDLYYLLSTSTADTRWPMGACGLTPGYTGHAFWDSDSWIFPALLLLHPQRAKSLVMFRAHTLPAAQARARDAGFAGAKYPWESDPERGTEETPHFAYVLGEREIHVNADIAIAQWQYWLASHDIAWFRQSGWPVIRNVADFWASRATWNAAANRYDIAHVTSVAESYNDVPNDTFTNVSAQKVLNVATQAAAIVGEKADPKWAQVAAKLYIPFSDADQRHYDFDPSVPRAPLEGSTVLMLMYPSLDLPMTPQVRRNDYAHAIGTTHDAHHEPNGMGVAPASIAAATVGETASAVRWLLSNFTNGMMRRPYNVRTETASNNTGYFITASGGFLQNLIFGFTGLRIEDKGLVEAYPPLLAPAWKSMTLKNVAFRGKHYDIRVDRDASDKVRLSRKAR